MRSGPGDVVDGWVISEQIGVRKPDRRIFEHAAEMVGQTLDGSWMLGDNPTADIGGAADAGFKTAWVNRYHRTWLGEEEPPPTFEHPAPAIDYAASAMSATARPALLRREWHEKTHDDWPRSSKNKTDEMRG